MVNYKCYTHQKCQHKLDTLHGYIVDYNYRYMYDGYLTVHLLFNWNPVHQC